MYTSEMIKIAHGTVIEHQKRRLVVVQVLDCSASFDTTEKLPYLPTVVACPLHGNVVRGRTRFIVDADSYSLVGGKRDVPVYKYGKEGIDL